MCRYQIRYDVSDNIGSTAVPLILNITFSESATITGSFLLIGQAARNSTAQQIALALRNTSSAVNAAFTATVASAFQSWLRQNTSAYVAQLVTGQHTETAAVSVENSARLALFSDVVQPDVEVLSSHIDQNITAQLSSSSTAAVQSYVYNVTLQVTVLTASLLSSVFVNVLNGSAHIDVGRHLLAESVALHPSKRCLQQSSSQASPTFPLASLLLFKVDLTLAAFYGTSNCSIQSIGDLFYGGADPPEALHQLCGSSAGDLSSTASLNQALLGTTNSSIPLLQVRASLHGMMLVSVFAAMQGTMAIVPLCMLSC